MRGRRALAAAAFQAALLRGHASRRRRGETLVVFANSAWGEVELPETPPPPGCRLSTDRRELSAADAVVFHVPTLPGVPRVKPAGQLWVAWWQECEAHYPRLRDPGFMRRFDLTVSHRLGADVVMPYTRDHGTPDALVGALRRPPREKTATAPAVLLVSSRFDHSGRIAYAAELVRHLDVHSYGAQLRNRALAADTGRPTKLELIARYKFTLAFENAVWPDYVTEKLYDPLVAGSVPVYLGAPNARDLAPAGDSFVNVADHATPRELADHLRALDADPAAYARLHAWRTRPLSPSFRALLAGQATHPFIRLCELVRARSGAGRGRRPGGW